MKHLLRDLRSRADERILRSATFCEECHQACTPDERREARLDDYHQAATGIGMFRH